MSSRLISPASCSLAPLRGWRLPSEAALARLRGLGRPLGGYAVTAARLAPLRLWLRIASVLLVVTLIYGCSSARISIDQGKTGTTERGVASWYGEPYHGRRTASGEIYDMYGVSAAHRSIAFGTIVEVKREDSGATVNVRINDRGPFISGRIIDLSFGAARQIGLDIDGIAPVQIKVLGKGSLTPKLPDSTVSENPCFWVQVGAFGDHTNADRAIETLKAGGEKALVMEGPNGVLRIRVGPFSEEKLAIAARDRLLDEWPVAAVVACGGK